MTEVARACGDAGRGEVIRSPSMISAIKVSGTLSRSSYVALRRAGAMVATITRPRRGKKEKKAGGGLRRLTHLWATPSSRRGATAYVRLQEPIFLDDRSEPDSAALPV